MAPRDYRQRTRARTTAETRERILEAALDVYARDGFDASFAAIAREAGVAAGTVHHHFDSPAALRAAVAEAFIRFELPDPDAIAAIADRGEALRTVLVALYQIFVDTTPLYRQRQRLAEPFPELERAEQQFYGRMTEALAAALGPVDPDRMRVVFAIASPGTAGAFQMVGMDVPTAAATAATLIERHLEDP